MSKPPARPARFPTPVTPGASDTRSRMFRPAIGRFRISVAEIYVATLASELCTGAGSDVTVTVSETLPTFSASDIVRVSAPPSVTLSCATDAKPLAETVILYLPGGRAGKP